MKKSVILALVLVLALSAFACGKPANLPENPSNPPIVNNGGGDKTTPISSPSPEPSETEAPTTMPPLAAGEMLIETLFELPYCVREDCGKREDNTDKIALLLDTGDTGKGEFYSAPRAFCVMDNRNICILDTYNLAIRLYDYESGSLLKTIDIDFMHYPSNIVSHGDLLYVFDTSTGKVYAIDVNTSEAEAFDLPQSAMGPIMGELCIYEGKLVFCRYSYHCDYLLEDGRFINIDKLYDTELEGNNFIITHGETKWTIPNEEIGLNPLGSDEEGNLYVCYSKDLDYTLRVYDKYSRLVKSCVIYPFDTKALPEQFICLDGDYNFMLMMVYESGVRIMRAVDAE